MHDFFAEFFTLKFLLSAIVLNVLINWFSSAVRPGTLAKWIAGKWTARSVRARENFEALVSRLRESASARESLKLDIALQRFESLMGLGVTLGLFIALSTYIIADHIDIHAAFPAMSAQGYFYTGGILFFGVATTRDLFSSYNKYFALKAALA